MWIHAESLSQRSQTQSRHEMRGYSFHECSPLEFHQGPRILHLWLGMYLFTKDFRLPKHEGCDSNPFRQNTLSYASLNECRGTNWFADGTVAVQVAELKMLKHVVEQISSAPLAECGRSFFPARIEGQKTYGLGWFPYAIYWTWDLIPAQSSPDPKP